LAHCWVLKDQARTMARPLGQPLGQPEQTYRLVRTESNRRICGLPGHYDTAESVQWRRSARPHYLDRGECFMGVPPEAVRPASRPCVPPRSRRQTEHYADRCSPSNRAHVAPVTPDVRAGQDASGSLRPSRRCIDARPHRLDGAEPPPSSPTPDPNRETGRGRCQLSHSHGEPMRRGS